MKSAKTQVRNLVSSFRLRSEKPRQAATIDSRTIVEASSEDDEDYDIARAGFLAGQDPLLPDLLSAVKDYQLTHGSLIKLTPHPATRHLPVAHTVLAHPIGVSLVPTLWPEKRFREVWDLQPLLQELYAKVASDPEYLWEVLGDCIAVEKDDTYCDAIISALWKIYEGVSNDPDGLGHTQEVELGLCRGDWMLDIPSAFEPQPNVRKDINAGSCLSNQPSLKQVELNTVATAGASHSSIVSDMHNHLAKIGIYSSLSTRIRQSSSSISYLPYSPPTPQLAPSNNGIHGFALALAKAHAMYGPAKSGMTTRTAILMVVQHNNVNIADERPIEYALWDMEPPIPCFRCEYRDIMAKTYFASPNPTANSKATRRALLFTPFPTSPPFEISVIYHRGSITAPELSTPPFPNLSSPHSGYRIRHYLERSLAIKCPSVLGQLASSKKVQQHLTSTPGAMERFVSPQSAQRLRERTMPMHSLADPTHPLRKILDACTPSPSGKAPESHRFAAQTALAKYVLKPIGAEGGGHCVFGADIPGFYADVIVPAKSQAGYILMERIHPPVVHGALISQRGYYNGVVVSELGILGTVLWRKGKRVGREDEGVEMISDGVEVIRNESVGWTLKSKSEEVKEMSVVKGYGCFDTPCLVDWEPYGREAREGVKEW